MKLIRRKEAPQVANVQRELNTVTACGGVK